jgi:hypothetical protein
MFGHQESTIGLRFYGLQQGHLGGCFDETAFASWLSGCILLHHFYGLTTPDTLPDPSMSDKEMVHLKLNKLVTRVENLLKNTVQKKEVQEVVKTELNAAIRADMLPFIQETITQALSPYLPPHTPQDKPPIVSVHPQRAQTLKELYRDSTAQFKSPHQAELFELVCQGARHVVGILPTGGGKGIAIFGPPKLERRKSFLHFSALDFS